MTVELTVISIRENPQIQRIKIGDSEIKLTQLADNMNCFITNIDSIIEIMNTFNKFKMCAGLNVNVEKTKAKFIGSFRERVNCPWGLDWSNDYIVLYCIVFILHSGTYV